MSIFTATSERLLGSADLAPLLGGIWFDHETSPLPTIHVALTDVRPDIAELVQGQVNDGIAVVLHEVAFNAQHLERLKDRISDWLQTHRDTRWSMLSVSDRGNCVHVGFPPATGPEQREAFRAAFPGPDVAIGTAEVWQD